MATKNLISSLGLAPLKKRTKSSMRRRADEILRIIRNKNLPKSVKRRALARAVFYKLKAG